MHLLKEDDTCNKVMPCCSGDTEVDNLLILASQMYEASREGGENDKMIDNIICFFKHHNKL